MASTNDFDISDILKLQALSSQEQDLDDDDDDEDSADFYDLADDSDDDDDDDGDRFLESEFDDDDDDADSYFPDSAYQADAAESSLEERRRRRSRGLLRRRRYRGRRVRRSRPVKGSRTTTLRSRTGQQMRVRLGKSFATSADVNKFIKDVDRKFALALKERKSNHDRLSKQITTNSRVIDGKVNRLNKIIKKLQQQAQTSSLLGLLQGSPKVETIELVAEQGGPALPPALQKPVEAKVSFKKQDILLPLILSGGLGGGGGAGGDNTILLALALKGKD